MYDSAGGAPKVKCVEYSYRRNLSMPGRTQYIVIDTSNWEIVKPTHRERSKTRAHGNDVYCLPEEFWNRVVVVRLKRSNSGKISFWAGSENPELRNYAREIEELLALCSDFEDMVETVEKYVDVKHLLTKDECEGGE